MSTDSNSSVLASETIQVADSYELSMSKTDVDLFAPIDAPFPFRNPHADVVLKSSDNVWFRVRKAILSEASPVFEDMFNLPPEQTTTSDSSTLPVVPLAEDSTIIEGLLRLCYPADTAPVDPSTIDQAVAWLVAARKYDMKRAERFITRVMHQMIPGAPLHAYCLAVRHRLSENFARAAAKHFLDEPLRTEYPSIDRELKHISAFAYMNLCNFHHNCSVAAQRAVAQYLPADSELEKRCWKTCLGFTGGHRCPRYSVASCTVDGAEYVVIGWFSKLMDHCKMLVKDRPSGNQLAYHDTIKESLTDAYACDHCKQHAWDDIQAFLALVRAQIDHAMAEVSCPSFRAS